jgi:protease YdgD
MTITPPRIRPIVVLIAVVSTGIGRAAVRVVPRWCERPARVAGALLLLAAAAFAAPSALRADEAAVGRVNVAGRSFCTGTLIAPQRALTAAHCLFDPRTGERAPIGDVHFVAGWERGGFVAHAQPTAIRIAMGYTWEGRRTLAGMERDLAILEFDRPVDAPKLAVGGDGAAAGSLTVVHYSLRRPHLAIRAEGCRRLGGLGRLWRLDCPVEPGGSGAPVLVANPNGLAVTAVAIGRARGRGGWITIALPITTPDLLR